MPIPADYVERVYAGVLGKIIGVYLGRPFEGWTHQAILEKLGDVRYYVHDRLGVPLVVTDDDISGTFTFIRALEDSACGRALTPELVGQTWLNYIIENRTILWWGGLGMSTEHTAYLRLKRGVPAPRSGSALLNGKTVSEQIGAQIFIDAWAMVAPGEPDLAAHLAGCAARVSHDGEAVYAAQVVASMEALAFVEPKLDRLLDAAVGLIPRDCAIFRLIDDLREFHAGQDDWRKAFSDVMLARYGYDRFGGNCHVVPNHGLIILGLLYGQDSFQQSLMITNTCGWDTDCNSGNVGCLMGIKNGLAGIDAGPDWRGPVADRMFLPTADGGSCITDALSQAYGVANLGLALHGRPPVTPKRGARFHFSLPGSIQGFSFESDDEQLTSERTLSNRPLQEDPSCRVLVIPVRSGSLSRVATATFIPPDADRMPGYTLMASPTLYPGQTVAARLRAERRDGLLATGRLFVRICGREDRLERLYGPLERLTVGQWCECRWRIPDTGGAPIAEVGLEFHNDTQAPGTILLDWLTWTGEPDVVLRRPEHPGTMWQRAWVDSGQSLWWGEHTYRVISNEGQALLSQGTRQWRNYRVSATMIPNLARAAGLAARVQGLRRYYALVLGADGVARLVRSSPEVSVLAHRSCPWCLDRAYNVALEVRDDHLRGWVDGQLLFEVEDRSSPLTGGGIALVCDEGRVDYGAVTVCPASG